ncbi:hypothetical protein Tco_0562097 [Tanacetum coccineum]
MNDMMNPRRRGIETVGEEKAKSQKIRSLRVTIHLLMNNRVGQDYGFCMFDPVTLSDAYQRALGFEKQNRRVRVSSSGAITGECKKAGKRTLFAEPEEREDDGVADDDYEEAQCLMMINMKKRFCNNLIAEEAVQKLGLKTENRPKPYKLQWLKKGGEVTISKRVLVTFSVGTTYKDSVWCDVVPMDAYHLLLGRPWEYDRSTTHDGRANTYCDNR